MPKAVKSGPAKKHVPESSFVSLVSGWVQQGIENLFATQRILVDLAMRQNTGTVKFVRERLADPEFCPAATVNEVVGESVSNFIEGQKTLLNLLKQEYEIVATGVKERVDGFASAVAVTDLVQRSLDTFVEMHQDFLKIVGKETHAWLAAVKNGKTYDPEGLVEAARESFDIFVHTQNKFLNLLKEETNKATSGNGVAKKMKKTEITELAQQATDSYVEAQKKLIELVGKQVNVQLKAAGQMLEMVAPSVNPIPEITRAGVKTFVDTEKAVIDTVTKSATEAKAKVEGYRKRHVRPLKVKMEGYRKHHVRPPKVHMATA